MKSSEFLENLRTAGLMLLAVYGPEPQMVIRSGRDGAQLPVQAVKVRKDKTEAFIILEFDPSGQYPTEDSYLRVCKASHWFQAQLRAHGIEPIRIEETMDHYPPDGFPFPTEEGIYKRALDMMFGIVPLDTWTQVATGEITPPWPLPEVLEAQGLKVPK